MIRRVLGTAGKSEDEPCVVGRKSGTFVVKEGGGIATGYDV